jgi:hypothetical protein
MEDDRQVEMKFTTDADGEIIRANGCFDGLRLEGHRGPTPWGIRRFQAGATQPVAEFIVRHPDQVTKEMRSRSQSRRECEEVSTRRVSART